MEVTAHQFDTLRIAEVTAGNVLINNAEEGLQLMVDLYYQEFDGIIIDQKQITPEFFDLKTGLAGEILQKVSNYRMRLMVVGDFDQYPGKSLKDFIYESNKGGQVNFLSSKKEALERLKI